MKRHLQRSHIFRLFVVSVTSLTLLSSIPAQSQTFTYSSSCDGYRYIYFDDNVDTLTFYGCRTILEPSSRPVNCELISTVDVRAIKAKVKEEWTNVSWYLGGFLLGSMCSGARYIIGRIFPTAAFGIWAFNRGANVRTLEHIKDDVRAGKKGLGEADPEAHYQSAGHHICSTLLGKADSPFSRGAHSGMKFAALVASQGEAIAAAAEMINRSPVTKRRAMFEELERNIDRQNKRNLAVTKTATGLLTNAIEFALSDSNINVPIGTTGQIAIVSPNACIPRADIEPLRQALETLPLKVDHIKERLKRLANQ